MTLRERCWLVITKHRTNDDGAPPTPTPALSFATRKSKRGPPSQRRTSARRPIPQRSARADLRFSHPHPHATRHLPHLHPPRSPHHQPAPRSASASCPVPRCAACHLHGCRRLARCSLLVAFAAVRFVCASLPRFQGLGHRRRRRRAQRGSAARPRTTPGYGAGERVGAGPWRRERRARRQRRQGPEHAMGRR